MMHAAPPDCRPRRPLRVTLLAAGALMTLLAPARPARAELPPLIPRAVLFSDPERENPLLSPDGTRIAYLARSPEGVLNIRMREAEAEPGRDTAVTHETKRGIPGFVWAPDGGRILYFQDSDGDENTHLFSVDLATGTTRDLTPFLGVRAQDLFTDPERSNEILIAMNLRDRAAFDVYRVDLATGAIVLDTENPGGVIAWTTDRDLAIRAATALDARTGDTVIRVRDAAGSPWRDLLVWPFEEAGNDIYQRVIAFAPDGRSLLVQSPIGANTTRLVRIDLATGREIETVSSDPRCDLWNYFGGASMIANAAVELDPESGSVQAVGFDHERPEWRILDPAVRPDFDALAKVHEGVPFLTSRDRADRRWIVGFIIDDGPTAYYLYDRTRREARPLFVDRPALAGLALAEMRPIEIRARDGLTLVSYLTLPSGIEPKGLPMLLLVHGGPWWRDEWGYDPVVQWLANRGYAVLQVEYRGSTGFGKAHLNASKGQFGVGGMQNDLSDAVAWAIREGIADPKRIGITGASYGGYATLAGLAFTPDLYACGVDLVGPSNMKTLIESFPAYWAPRRMRWLLRVGNVLEDDALNERISPFFHVDAIRAPLLIGQGANDPRVKIDQSDSIVQAMRARGLPVMYVVYPDEGHGFARAENNTDFNGRTEEFLAKYLGGRAEPWNEVPGSSAQVR